MTDILSHDATDQLRALETKAISAVELLDAAVGRYEATHAQLNAVVATDLERARQRARAIDERRARGETLGPLAGLPMTIKDSLDVEHMPASSGLEALRQRAAARRVAIVKSGNYSLGVNVLAGLVQQAAQRLSANDWDIEVFEAHHRRKVDAPSGTALMLGEAAARGRQSELAAVQVRARDGITGPRPQGAIGFSVMRGGGIVGEHSVTFAAEEETLTFSHSARDRSLFAAGAVKAALWVAGRPPGLYDMMDVLGFR